MLTTPMTALETLNALCPGWSESGNGLICNPNEGGGIIDCTFVSGEWFVVFNDDRETLDGFATRDDAVAAFVALHQN